MIILVIYYLLFDLKTLSEKSRADEKMVVSFWKHEMERLIKDQICRQSDVQWFQETMKEIINKVANQNSNIFSFIIECQNCKNSESKHWAM